MTPCPATPAHGAPGFTRRAALLWAALSTAAVAAQAPAAPAGAPRLPAVVVWDFEDRTVPALSALPPGQADWLRRSLSEALAGALLRTPGQIVVDRLRLREVLAEQNLGSAALADADARLQLGRIVGAGRMVFGSFFVVGDAVQVNLRVVDTATSRVLFADEATAPFDTVMAEQPQWAARVVRALGGEAPGGGAAAGGAYPAALWQAHDAAAALADAGRFDDAVAALQGLLQQRSDFEPAERLLSAVLQTMARR
jgi:curli biogenesis system outer membrane secretion channel CsgG